MIPPIKIQISGNSCSCCTEDNDPKEFKIVYRADKDIFVAVPSSKEIPMSAIIATREALNVILQENYFVALNDIHITSTPNSPISVRQVEQIQGLAAQRLKKASTDSL